MAAAIAGGVLVIAPGVASATRRRSRGTRRVLEGGGWTASVDHLVRRHRAGPQRHRDDRRFHGSAVLGSPDGGHVRDVLRRRSRSRSASPSVTFTVVGDVGRRLRLATTQRRPGTVAPTPRRRRDDDRHDHDRRPPPTTTTPPATTTTTQPGLDDHDDDDRRRPGGHGDHADLRRRRALRAGDVRQPAGVQRAAGDGHVHRHQRQRGRPRTRRPTPPTARSGSCTRAPASTPPATRPTGRAGCSTATSGFPTRPTTTCAAGSPCASRSTRRRPVRCRTRRRPTSCANPAGQLHDRRRRAADHRKLANSGIAWAAGIALLLGVGALAVARRRPPA